MEREILISIYVLFGVVGLCVGSFLNVVIYRLPNKMSLATPASHCTTCGYQLKWYDNIPVLSYLMLGGKCRSCKEKISPRYMIVEIVNCALWLAIALLFAEKYLVYAICSALLCSLLICVFFIDLKEMIIYDRFQIMIAVLGLVVAFFSPAENWVNHLIGGLVGGAVFLIIYYGAILILKKEGLGFGDVKLSAGLGLFLGWEKYILMMLIASVSASVILSILRRKSGENGKEFPFAPFITVGAVVALLVGDLFIGWYLGLLLA